MKFDKIKKIGEVVLAGLAILWAAAKILSLILQYREILREPDGLETVLLSVLITVVIFGIILAAVEAKRRKNRNENTKSTVYSGETAQAESTGKTNNRFLNTGSIIKILIYVYVGLFLFIVSIGEVDPEDGIYVFALMIIVTLVILGLLRSRKMKASREQSDTYIRAQTEAQSGQRKPASPEDFDLDEYDRRKRIEQLDGFLESGLIDREEYRRMKERYEER